MDKGVVTIIVNGDKALVKAENSSIYDLYMSTFAMVETIAEETNESKQNVLLKLLFATL